MTTTTMTPRALKAWRQRLDLSQEGFARWLGVSRSTVNRWEGGLAPIPKMVALVEREHTAKQLHAELRAEDTESSPSDRERRVHVGHRRAAGDRRANRFSPADY